MGRPVKNLTGIRVGRLIVIKQVGFSKQHNALWLCKCDCGNEKVIVSSSLVTGDSQSCGCYMKDKSIEAHLTHGCSGKNITPEYSSWSGMKERCLNKKHMGFYSYGGRGITICDEWINSFETFLRDMGIRPKGTSLDRIDVNGNYCKENCRWATPREQRRNTRNTTIVVICGLPVSLPDLYDSIDIGISTINERRKHGYSTICALWLPVSRKTAEQRRFGDFARNNKRLSSLKF